MLTHCLILLILLGSLNDHLTTILIDIQAQFVYLPLNFELLLEVVIVYDKLHDILGRLLLPINYICIHPLVPLALLSLEHFVLILDHVNLSLL